MKMQKKQFRIGELALSLGVKRFVVRFWEKEFNLSAHRSNGGQRFYSDKDLERFHAIKKLLYEEGFTIAGAKKKLKIDGTKILASHKISLEEVSAPQMKAQPEPSLRKKSSDHSQLTLLRKKLTQLRESL